MNDLSTSTESGAAAAERLNTEPGDDHRWYGRAVRADVVGDYPTEPVEDDGFCHCNATHELYCVCP